MRKALLLICLLAGLNNLIFAQEPTDTLKKMKEFGLNMSSFNNFGVSFRWGNETRLFRFNTLSLIGNEEYEYNDSRSNLNINLGAGIEFRYKINERLTARSGVDGLFSFNNSSNTFANATGNKSKQFSGGLGIVAGANYTINNYLIIGLEFIPSFQYYQVRSEFKQLFYDNNNLPVIIETSSFREGFRYGFNTSSALLTVIAQF